MKEQKWLVNKENFLVEKVRDEFGKIVADDMPTGAKKALRMNYRPDRLLSKEDVEDAYMDAILKAYQDNEKIDDKTLYGRVRYRATTKQYVNTGLNQDGTMPKSGKRYFNIKNDYDQDNNNKIETAGIDETGRVIYDASPTGGL